MFCKDEKQVIDKQIVIYPYNRVLNNGKRISPKLSLFMCENMCFLCLILITILEVAGCLKFYNFVLEYFSL